jgi:thiamine biosynthesis lipoprotein
VVTLTPPLVAYHVAMDTTITIEAPGAPEGSAEAVRRAFGWFDQVERVCSRFDAESELSQLCHRPGEAVPVSELLFSALRFALHVAAASGGAFDPTIGAVVSEAGFNRNYRTGELAVAAGSPGGSYRDVLLGAGKTTVRLLRPLQLDLGAVAKGLAVDLAARELAAFPGFAINAGGDVFVRGRNAEGGPWRIGVRDPRDFDSLAETFVLDGAALCTSGDYERRDESTGVHHLFDARSRSVVHACASASVIAPTAMAADALATAAFALGPMDGIAFLESQGVEGLIITPDGGRFETAGLKEYIA